MQYYFRAHMMERDEKNYFAWVQGAYNFAALNAALNGFAGASGTASEYLKEPTPIRQKTEEEQEAEIEAQRRKIVASLNRFHAIMEAKTNAGQQT